MMKRSFLVFLAILNGMTMTACTSLGPAFYADMEAERTVASQKIARERTSRTLTEVTKKSGKTTETPQQSNRLMIYKADVSMIVENVEETLEALSQATKKTGGHVQSLESNALLVRIPATALEDFLKGIPSFGAIISKSLTGEDVTDTMRDMDIRLKTATEMHKRLLVLFERAQKVEDMLKIEREIQRVVGTIELIKGKRQALTHDIAYSTVRIRVNSPLPQKRIDQEVPFTWVQSLGDDLATGRTSERWTDVEGDHVAFELPAGFAMYHRSRYVTRAMSANDVILKVRRHENFKGADLDFWLRVAAKSLRLKRCLALSGGESITVYNGKKKGWLIQGTRTIGTKSKKYLLVLASTKDHVYSYEVWGDSKAFDAVVDEVKKSVETWRPGRWFE